MILLFTNVDLRNCWVSLYKVAKDTVEYLSMKSEQPQLIDSGAAVDESGLVHRVWQPDGAGPHPTIVMLQGRQGNEDVTWVFGRTLPKEWLIVSPRAPLPEEGGYSWDIRPDGSLPALHHFDAAVATIERFITALPSLYNADLSRLYLLGFSQGAAASLAYTMRNPDAVQGIASLVGFLPTTPEHSPILNNLADKPIMMLVGRTDERVTLQVAQQSAQRLVSAGARLDYREYDTGHKLNVRGMNDLTAWWQQWAKK